MNKPVKPSSPLTRKLLLDYFLPLGIYSGLLIMASYSISWICRQHIWQYDDAGYQLLKYFDIHFMSVFSLVLLAFWVLYTYRFIRRVLRYLDEVAQAAQKLATPTQEPIALSSDIGYMENDLNRVREQAYNSMRAAKDAEQRKNDLVVYLAHDLKTPLTSVIGYLTLLHDEQQISPELREKYLGIALDKAERLEELINEFFEITRFNLSEITLEYSRVNLTRLLEQLSYEFQPMFREKQLQCSLSVPPDTMLRCDVDKLQRVLDNLLRNAVNYSFPGSTIRISAEPMDGQLQILVENQGNTIPPEKLDRIFEQFFRLDTARTSGTGGAGLGLAIAKEIVEHHGGTITARSADERVCFEVRIPIT